VELTCRSPRFLRAAGAALLTTALFAGWVGLDLGGDKATLWMDDLVTPLAAGLGCGLCLAAARRHSGRMRTFWGLLCAAMACWTLAETIWGIYALLLEQEVPVPSWADLGYLSAIPLAVAALIMHPATGGAGSRSLRSTLDALAVATALLFLSWTLVLGSLWHGSDLTTLSGIVAVAYPFGDVVIAFFIVLAIHGMTGDDRLSLWCLLAGLMAMALSDSIYTYYTEVAKYSSSSANLIDAGWVAGYLFIGLAALGSGVGNVARRVRPETRSSASLVAPLLPMLVALVAAAVEIELGDGLDHAGVTIALVLIVLVLLRQALLLRDLSGPGGGGRAGSGTSVARVALGEALVTGGVESSYERISRHDRA
jgi:hypothetical protein